MSEARCHRCGGPNIVWSAPSPLWNALMRRWPNQPEQWGGIICPTCFAELCEDAGLAQGWRLSAMTVDPAVSLTSPDGRVWDAIAWRWVIA